MKDIDFTHKDALISSDEIKDTAETLSGYVEKLSNIARDFNEKETIYDEAESSINLPFDEGTHKKVKDLVKKIKTTELKYVIVVGIGGSNLGTKAIYDAIRGTTDSFLTEDVPKIIFADTTSTKLLKGISEILKENIEKPEEVLVNIISKSGTTTESIANFEIIYSFLKNRFKNGDDIKNRVIVTTDHGSRLWEKAEECGIKVLSAPKNVGGRYSVFSTVGIFPLMLSKVNTEALLDGARIMRDKCIKNDVTENQALVSAVITYIHNKKGISINNNFFFNPHLESIGRWYRQLMGESIGKKYAIDGREVNSGITPIVSIGSTDLHSMSQLYLGGPKDKLTTFVYSQEESRDTYVPEDVFLEGLVEGIEGKKLVDIMDAIFSGVKEAYKNNKLPFVEISLEDTNEYTLGQFLQFKMIEMMYLAKLLEVNAFDQPNVEDYKGETRKILLEGK